MFEKIWFAFELLFELKLLRLKSFALTVIVFAVGWMFEFVFMLELKLLRPEIFISISVFECILVLVLVLVWVFVLGLVSARRFVNESDTEELLFGLELIFVFGFVFILESLEPNNGGDNGGINEADCRSGDITN